MHFKKNHSLFVCEVLCITLFLNILNNLTLITKVFLILQFQLGFLKTC